MRLSESDQQSVECHREIQSVIKRGDRGEALESRLSGCEFHTTIWFLCNMSKVCNLAILNLLFYALVPTVHGIAKSRTRLSDFTHSLTCMVAKAKKTSGITSNEKASV